MIPTGASTEDESKRVAQRARARKIRQRRRRIREQSTVHDKDSNDGDVHANKKSVKIPVRRSKRLRDSEEERKRVWYSGTEQNAQPNGQPANGTLEWDEPPCKKHRLSKLEEESAKELETIDGIGPSLASILVKSNLLGNFAEPVSLDALAKWVQQGKYNQDALLRFFRYSESIPKETKKWEGWNTRTAPKILKKLLEYKDL
eukprot:jgi/Picsp_1/6147/NSC_03501-R1_hypothetical protein CHLNCDRAFT_57600 [Chlorella variabilis]